MQRFPEKARALLIALLLISSAGFISQVKALGAAHEQIYTANGSYNGIFYQIVDAGTNYVYQQGYDLVDYNCLISPPSINLKFVISNVPANYTYLYTEEWASNGAQMIDTGISFTNYSWVMPLINILYHFEVHVSFPAPTPSPTPDSNVYSNFQSCTHLQPDSESNTFDASNCSAKRCCFER